MLRISEMSEWSIHVSVFIVLVSVRRFMGIVGIAVTMLVFVSGIVRVCLRVLICMCMRMGVGVLIVLGVGVVGVCFDGEVI